MRNQTREWAKYFLDDNVSETAPVLQFQGDHRFLSSFTPSIIIYNGIRYPSVEHAYQMMKIGDKDERARLIKALNILELPSNKVKTLSRKFDVRPDWDEIKTSIMLDLVRIKFSIFNANNKDNRNDLMNTCTVFPKYPLIEKEDLTDSFIERINDINSFKVLIEGNSWNDKFWGVCLKSQGQGQNHLGKIIMQVRNEEIITTYNFYDKYCNNPNRPVKEYPQWQTWLYTSYSGAKFEL